MTANAAPVGGLVGAAASLSQSTGRAARKAWSIVGNPDRWALYLVLFAGVITIVKKNATPEVWSYAMWFGIALGIAALLYEMSSAKSMVKAWYHGRFGAVVWSAFIWAVAFGFSINNWIGAAAENQAEKTNVHKAAFMQSADVRKAVTDLEKELARLEGKHDWAKNVDAPEAYEDRIKAAEADAAYEATRRGCKSKCIAKQQLAASLKAERAIAIDRATTSEEIKATKAKLDEAREIASNTKVETSEARNDLIILTKYAGMSEEAAQIFNGLFSIIAISIFLSFASMRDQLEEERKNGPRQHSNIGLRIKRWFARIFLGREPKGVEIVEQHNITVHDDRAMEKLRHLASGLKTANLEAAA